MVLINFAQRRIIVNLALVGADASSVLRALAAQVPGDRDGPTNMELGEAATLRPRGFAFDTGPQPSEQELDHDPNTVGGMQTEYLLSASASVPLPPGIDGLLFVCDAIPGRREAHRASLEAVCAALREVGLQPKTIPMVFLWTRGAPEAEAYADLERTVCPGARGAVPSYAGEPGEAAPQAFARLGGGRAAEAQQAVLLLHVRPPPPATPRRGPPRPRERGVGVGPPPRVPTSGTPSQRGDLPDGSTTLSA